MLHFGCCSCARASWRVYVEGERQEKAGCMDERRDFRQKEAFPMGGVTNLPSQGISEERYYDTKRLCYHRATLAAYLAAFLTCTTISLHPTSSRHFVQTGVPAPPRAADLMSKQCLGKSLMCTLRLSCHVHTNVTFEVPLLSKLIRKPS